MSATFGFTGRGRVDVVTPEELTSVDDHLATILENVLPLEPIRVHVNDSLGLVMAAPVAASEPLPAFANSAMDGYALVSGDVVTASTEDPVALRVVGEVAAGAAELPVVQSGHAVRIMTGAPLPPGADAVVPVEQTVEGGGVVQIFVPVSQGRHVRRVGEDIQAGQALLAAGRRIGPGDIALLAATGHAEVAVFPAPRVVVMSTGNELVPTGTNPQAGQIRDSNGPMMSALVRQAGALPYRVSAVADDRKSLAEAIDTNLGHADLFITTGGVSAGLHDHLREVLERLGTVHAAKVAMKPGMPQVFATVQGRPVLGFPGNPGSAFVSFEVFGRPVIRRLQGRRDRGRPVVRAVLTQPLKSPPHKRGYVRVTLHREDKRWVATPIQAQGSHQLAGLVQADGLAEVPAHLTQLDAGDRIAVHLLADL